MQNEIDERCIRSADAIYLESEDNESEIPFFSERHWYRNPFVSTTRDPLVAMRYARMYSHAKGVPYLSVITTESGRMLDFAPYVQPYRARSLKEVGVVGRITPSEIVAQIPIVEIEKLVGKPCSSPHKIIDAIRLLSQSNPFQPSTAHMRVKCPLCESFLPDSLIGTLLGAREGGPYQFCIDKLVPDRFKSEEEWPRTSVTITQDMCDGGLIARCWQCKAWLHDGTQPSSSPVVISTPRWDEHSLKLTITNNYVAPLRHFTICTRAPWSSEARNCRHIVNIAKNWEYEECPVDSQIEENTGEQPLSSGCTRYLEFPGFCPAGSPEESTVSVRSAAFQDGRFWRTWDDYFDRFQYR